MKSTNNTLVIKEQITPVNIAEQLRGSVSDCQRQCMEIVINMLNLMFKF